jgi:hypothetical protein
MGMLLPARKGEHRLEMTNLGESETESGVDGTRRISHVQFGSSIPLKHFDCLVYFPDWMEALDTVAQFQADITRTSCGRSGRSGGLGTVSGASPDPAGIVPRDLLVVPTGLLEVGKS